MHILLLHQQFLPPDSFGSGRFNQFVDRWRSLGHDVTILASPVHYASGEKDSRYRASILSTEQTETGAEVLRPYVPELSFGSTLGRLTRYASFSLSATIAGVVKEIQPDVVLATSPPLTIGPPAAALSRIKGVPFVFEIRDLWPDFAVEMGKLENPFARRFAYGMESWLYDAADKISVLTPGYEEALTSKGVPRDKMIYAPTGSDLETFHPGAPPEGLRAELGWEDRTVFLYLGAHGQANHLDQVIEAAARLPESSDVLFSLVGDGPEKDRLVERAAGEEVDNVQFLDPVPRRRAADLLRAADVGLAVLKDVSGFRNVYPNKVYDSLASGKPVLLAIDGVVRDLVEGADAGVAVPPEAAEALAKEAQRLADQPSERKRMGRNAAELMRQEFDMRELADWYVRELELLVP